MFTVTLGSSRMLGTLNFGTRLSILFSLQGWCYSTKSARRKTIFKLDKYLLALKRPAVFDTSATCSANVIYVHCRNIDSSDLTVESIYDFYVRQHVFKLFVFIEFLLFSR